MNTKWPIQQFVRFKADTPGLQSNKVWDTALLLPDNDTKLIEETNMTWALSHFLLLSVL